MQLGHICFGNSYRYGFNGMEKDDEIKGSGNSYDFGARIYDSRIGRFLSIDPKVKEYPFWSPYLFAGNNPVKFIDLYGEGLGEKIPQGQPRGKKDVNFKIFGPGLKGLGKAENAEKANPGTVFQFTPTLPNGESAKNNLGTSGAIYFQILKPVLAQPGGGYDPKPIDDPDDPAPIEYTPKSDVSWYQNSSNVQANTGQNGIAGNKTSFFNFVSREAIKRPVLLTGSKDFINKTTEQLLKFNVPKENILTIDNLTEKNKKDFSNDKTPRDGFYYIKEKQ